jgi:phosphatidylinositol-bisphosphatase
MPGLKVLVCSWNVGNAPPPATFAPWIPPGGGGSDIIAVGLQECAYTPPTKEDGGRRGSWKEGILGSVFSGVTGEGGTFHFLKQVQEYLGDAYVPVSAANLMQIRLLVMIRRELVPHLRAVEKSAEATGQGHVLGNKGGVVVKLEVHGTSLCFVNAHLAAHEQVR